MKNSVIHLILTPMGTVPADSAHPEETPPGAGTVPYGNSPLRHFAVFPCAAASTGGGPSSIQRS